jgi:hypothetical protein
MDINSKLGEKIWKDTWMVLPIYIFKAMRNCNITFKELYDAIKKWIKFRNEVFGRNYDNTEVYLMRENKRFGFFLSPNISKFILYNDDSNHLGDFKINIDEIPNEEFIKWIEKTTDEYIKGIIHCSDCGKEINYDEIAGRYFAGNYCKDCWEREWKEREAKENYD